ncbi:unnamed protein product [Pseudo-nitzschia multistriata]|uniref:Uncharacterized protein n=1 Tax=Pseudo-nitzschia multistriata TaxID=183589 RepID=A0A448ZF60_9STRA|nr:unnamed protein product [Pseudo-nitzschia multistriata]
MFSRAVHNSLRSTLDSFSFPHKETFKGCINPSVDFDHDQWWAENEYIVKYLLEGSDSGDNTILFSDDGGSFSSSRLLGDHFERAYASDAIYQDLFVDTPPCRETLKFSFQLIHWYWDIKVTSFDPPTLLRSFPYYDINSEGAYTKNESAGENMLGGTKRDDVIHVVRVPYNFIQQPRLPFLSSHMFERFPLLPALKQKIIEHKYEGWIDFYLRRTASSRRDRGSSETGKYKNCCNTNRGDRNCANDKNGEWEVFRHDDRLRIFLPNFLRPYISFTSEKVGDRIDALSIIERIHLFSIFFQQFRLLHGKLLHFYLKKKARQKAR